MEHDIWSRDDQIVKPVDYNSGNGINKGDWRVMYLIYGSSWSQITIDGENDEGDYFEIRMINLDY